MFLPEVITPVIGTLPGGNICLNYESMRLFVSYIESFSTLFGDLSIFLGLSIFSPVIDEFGSIVLNLIDGVFCRTSYCC